MLTFPTAFCAFADSFSTRPLVVFGARVAEHND